MDHVEPPAMELARPIANRGAEAVDFLKEELNIVSDGSSIWDILLIFDVMASSGSYSVKDDAALMSLLDLKSKNIRDSRLQNMCEVVLTRIRNAR
jgi:hypothetical protein